VEQKLSEADDGRKPSLGQKIRRYMIAGLLLWLPVGVTVIILRFLVDLMDRTLLLLPAGWRPDALLGFRIPGLGLLLALVVLLITGVALTNLVGRQLIHWWENLLKRIPIVRSIYSGAKIFTETVFSDKGKAFKSVLLVEYPRKGIWTLGFQSGEEVAEVVHRVGRGLVCVFIPTTPNPTSGFIIMVPREDVMPLDMSVDDAMRLIFTLGVVAPDWAEAVQAKGLSAGTPPTPR
jgi:uncharacterized membrane protein